MPNYTPEQRRRHAEAERRRRAGLTYDRNDILSDFTNPANPLSPLSPLNPAGIYSGSFDSSISAPSSSSHDSGSSSSSSFDSGSSSSDSGGGGGW